MQNGDKDKDIKSAGGEAGNIIEIIEHPFAERPFASVVTLIVIILVSIGSYYMIENAFTPVFVFIFFIISNASFFMRSKYIFTEEKIIVDRIIYRQSYPWSRFRSYQEDKNGIFLSPASDPEKFDRFRGLFMVMKKENRDKIKHILDERLKCKKKKYPR